MNPMHRHIITGIVAAAVALGCGNADDEKPTSTPDETVALACTEICAHARECDAELARESCEADCSNTSVAFSESTIRSVNACVNVKCASLNGCMTAIYPTCSPGSEDIGSWLDSIRDAATTCGGFEVGDFQAFEDLLQVMGCFSDAGRDRTVACAGSSPCGDGEAWASSFEECMVVAVPFFEELEKGF